MMKALTVIFCSLFCFVACGPDCNSNKFPIEGNWSDTRPHWTPKGCIIKPFSATDTVSCLTGRTVYALGSSICRNYVFELATLLGAKSVSREEQKKRCTKGPEQSFESCVDEINEVKFKFMFLQSMDTTFAPYKMDIPIDDNNRRHLKDKLKHTSIETVAIDHNSGHSKKPAVPSHPFSHGTISSTDWFYTLRRDRDDTCWNKKIEDCLRTFFNGSTSNDILILSGMGLTNAWALREKPNYEYWALMDRAGTNFAHAVNTLFSGTVIRGTLTEMRDREGNSNPSTFLYETEEQLSLLFAKPATRKPWITIDQWSINRGRTDLYSDFIHFPGKLTTAFLDIMLTEICTSNGLQ